MIAHAGFERHNVLRLATVPYFAGAVALLISVKRTGTVTDNRRILSALVTACLALGSMTFIPSLAGQGALLTLATAAIFVIDLAADFRARDFGHGNSDGNETPGITLKRRKPALAAHPGGGPENRKRRTGDPPGVSGRFLIDRGLRPCHAVAEECCGGAGLRP